MYGEYNLSLEQAETAPRFYLPDASEDEMPRKIKAKESHTNGPRPYFELLVEPNSTCRITLNPINGLIKCIALITPLHSRKKYDAHVKNFRNAKKRLEEALGFELNGEEY